MDAIEKVLSEAAGALIDLVPVIVGIDRQQTIKYWYDRDGMFGYERPPIGALLSILFDRPEFLTAHQVMVERFLDSGIPYRTMSGGRPFACRDSRGMAIEVSVRQMRRVEGTGVAPCALAVLFPMGMPAPLPAFAIHQTKSLTPMPPMPGEPEEDDDSDELVKRISAAAKAVERTTTVFEMNKGGAWLLILLALLLGLFVLAYSGKIPTLKNIKEDTPRGRLDTPLDSYRDRSDDRDSHCQIEAIACQIGSVGDGTRYD